MSRKTVTSKISKNKEGWPQRATITKLILLPLTTSKRPRGQEISVVDAPTYLLDAYKSLQEGNASGYGPQQYL